MNPYFTFNNISSEDFLTVDKLPSIIRATKNIQKIEIEGRDGFLTQDNGSYKGILKTVECWIKDLKDIDFICEWLSGSSEVIFSNEPEKIYKTTIINQIEFIKFMKEFHKFIILFECQPHKYSLNNTMITLKSAGAIYNNGSNSKPIIKIYGSGTINLIINDNIITIDNISEYVVINSDLMDCYKDTLLKNNDMSGEFPELLPGINNISWTGALTKIEITPNWRWL